jgi:hypothetical protein
MKILKSSFLNLKDLRDALKIVGIDIPGCDARFLEDEFKRNDINRDGKLSLNEFSKVKSKRKITSF